MQQIQGLVENGFEPVRRAFRDNFVQGREVGAGVAVYQDGHPVVDLWAGLADPDGGRLWQQDTLVNVASVTKSMAATALLVLIERGELRLDDRVAEHWPDFAAEGKGDITLRTLLSHRAGVPSLEHRPLTYEALLAGTPVMDAIAAARPEWEPGAAHGYHGLTLGHAISAVIQRITGRTVGRFFADEIAGPLSVDCLIGVPDAAMSRVATMIVPNDPDAVAMGLQVPELRPLLEALNDPHSLTYRALYGSMTMGWESANDPKYLQVEAPSTDGVASASGLARMYAALIGPVDGTRLLSPELIMEASRVHSTGHDRVLNIRSDFGLGFMLPGGPLFPSATGRSAFGHGGTTGSFAFADPDLGLAFGYVPNRGSELLEGNDLRVQALAAAVYESVNP